MSKISAFLKKVVGLQNKGESKVRKIEINPMTRLEGHGKIAIFLDDNGNVDDAFFQTVEFRGYEKFLQGMPIEEVPRTVSTVCGVCRAVHFLCAMKASDDVYGVTPPTTGRKLRELFYSAHTVEDHTAVLYALGFPDFVVGPDAPAGERNLVGLIKAVGAETGKLVLRKRGLAVKIFELLGGKPNHPVSALPGGWSKSINEDERAQIEKWAEELVELGKLTLQVFEDVVLKNPKYMELVTGDMFKVEVGYIATVDEQNKMAFYDGTQKAIDARGNVVGTFKGKEYLDFISERVLPWSYLKFPYNKKLGAWDGIKSGPDTNIYCVGPLARMNVTEGITTPLAHEHFEKFHNTFGAKPVHYILGYHWARAIEVLAAAEKCLELSRDPEITGTDTWSQPTSCTKEGVGILEANRGVLIHHYVTDENGIVENANLVVATTHNNAPINLAVKTAAKHFIKDGNVTEGLLNHVEMAFRPYDLCLACATHTVTGGQMPMEVNIFNSNGQLNRQIKNF